MTEPNHEIHIPEVPEPRRRRDRRHNGGSGRRGQRTRTSWARVIGGYLFMALTLVVTIIFAVMSTRPIFAGRATVTQQLAERGRQIAEEAQASRMAAVDGPGGPNDTLSTNPEFQRDRRAFADDMLRHGHIDSARADSVAYYAVREAYKNNIPPALIFGLMLTENSRFVSKAKSNVGAKGLMQIYPKYWLKPLGKKFGTDLEADSTNMKYGAFILKEYITPKKGQTRTYTSLRKGLLKYNGCVRGTNTPNCHTYPSKIEKYVDTKAIALCRGRSFDECITQPFVRGLLGEPPLIAGAD